MSEVKLGAFETVVLTAIPNHVSEVIEAGHTHRIHLDYEANVLSLIHRPFPYIFKRRVTGAHCDY